ncbi:hypothetical protein [Anaeromicropila populeti]|uniref:Uncharacterized protein n=1 Tax=Anaeromicropila populeti TaxID=37658 RepID=A0A1I6JIK1_9FIRM|nr:hypothetical protein [Anaeromicropila populeti]SFR78709.1 hypothetical protein SAMN05661086_01715 [Anaeromicropila populeti]
MNTYENLKKIIVVGKKTKDEIVVMMNVFLINFRITNEQYDELMTLLNSI